MRNTGIGERLFTGLHLKRIRQLLDIIGRIKRAEAKEIAALNAGELNVPVVCFAVAGVPLTTELNKVQSRALAAAEVWTIKQLGIPTVQSGDTLA